jgi:hypothetical protein
MPAFGMNRFTQAYAVAANDAGTRINDKPISCVDLLAYRLFEWGGAKNLATTFNFVYPFVGGTADSHSINLADPTTGRIIWEDTVTHNANGITGDGVSGCGRTGATLAGPAVKDAFVSFGVYSRTANTGNYNDIGNYSGVSGVPGGLLIRCRWGDALAAFYNSSAAGLSISVPNSQGLFACLRTTAAALWAYRNGALVISGTLANAVVDPPIPLMILARPDSVNPDVPIQFSSRNLAFAFLSNAPDTPGIGAINTTAKMTDLYTYVQSFQTKLGRQV